MLPEWASKKLSKKSVKVRLAMKLREPRVQWIKETIPSLSKMSKSRLELSAKAHETQMSLGLRSHEAFQSIQ